MSQTSGLRKEARNEKRAVCPVCMHHCELYEGQYGRCRARKNQDGSIICANYGKVTALALDPIEKKPLNRFYPGTRILSAGSYGCNLSCPFCQNHDISMADDNSAEYTEISPEHLMHLARRYREYGNIGVAFTYNEPLISYEYIRDTARLLYEHDMKTVLVTNGCAELSVLEELLPCIDAMNIDLKGFTKEYYRMVGGDLDMVKRFIQRAALECHVEVTTLIVPGENDSEAEMDREADWIASVNPEIPLHISRFFPRYRMSGKEATDISLIYRLKETANKHLKYVYTGNC